MKYLFRSLKWLLWFVVIFALIILVLILVNPSDNFTFQNLFTEGGMFKEGSQFKLLAFFIVAAAIYPALTYVKKEVFVDGSYEKCKDKIFQGFTEQGYVFISEDSEKALFRKSSPLVRFMRNYEDKVTITKGESPLIMEGIRKDIIRVASAIEFATRTPEEDNQ